MKVILTTDGSDAAEQAIRWFSQLPIHGEECYEVLTVVGPPIYGIVPGDIQDEICRLGNEYAENAFHRAATIMKGFGLLATHVRRRGHPADEITQYAKDCGAELVVVGAHGASRLSRMLIGSVSEAVGLHAPCSVLVMRESDQSKAAAIQPLRVTIASDGSGSPVEMAAQVCDLGLPINTKISLVSVVEHPPLLDPEVQYDTQLNQAMETNLTMLADRLKTFPSIEQHVLEQKHVGSCIESYLLKDKSDIVIVRDKGRSAISRFFMGSVSRYIMHHAHCSVLVLRTRHS